MTSPSYDLLAQITSGHSVPPSHLRRAAFVMAFPDSVLIVDDDPAILVALSDMLMYRLRDVRVTTRGSAITGLEALRNTNYRVLIADLRMPEMDGLTLLRHVHQVREHTPVI